MFAILKKIIKRLLRIVSGRKGVYCKQGKGNHFCTGVFIHENTSVGDYNYFGHRAMALNCRVGNYCSIAADVKLGQTNHDVHCVSTNTHIYEEITGNTSFQGPTVIENDVWIAANSVVLQGVTIGTGAVIGAGAVVTKDVPPYAVAVGVPAKVIHYRFDTETIDMLLKSNWWDHHPKAAIEICRKLQASVRR